MKTRLKDLLGAHVSAAGGVFNAPGRAASLPARAMAIFTKNQNQWAGKPLADSAVERWFEELQTHDMAPEHVCSHDAYLINLASPRPEILHRSRDAFVDEIERCARLGIPYLVFHPGSHLGAGEQKGLAAIAASLDLCIDRAASGAVPGTEKVMLCLETTAGMGHNLGHRFEHLRDIMALSRNPDRLQICVDTCHIFAAGYALSTPYQTRKTLRTLDDVVGLDRVKVLHLNDSKRIFASRVDRHARIGQGEIGLEAFQVIVRARRLAGALKILEVPGGEEAYREDLALLRSLLRG